MRNFLSRRRDEDFGFDLFDRAFDEFFKPAFFGGVQASTMKTDLKENDKEYELSIDMPGYEKSDIALTLENGYLTVTAKREEKEEDEKNYLRRERSYSCSRSYYVGDSVTEEDVKAKYLNGTLNLIVPKKEKQIPQKKNIEID